MNGKITITRNSNDKIHITISDSDSAVTFFDGHMELEDFASAVTGLSRCPIEFRLMGTEKVGMKLENKTIRIPYPYDWTLGKPFMEDMRELVKPYEVDGWKATDIESMNHHKYSNQKYAVSFRRYVSVDSEK